MPAAAVAITASDPPSSPPRRRSLKKFSSVRDVREKVQKQGGETTWSADDPRWEEQPLSRERYPTAVFMKIELLQLKDLNTELGTAFVKLRVFLNWHDERLVGRGIKPFGDNALPPRLWSPLLELGEAMADMQVTTRAFMQVPFAGVKCVEGDCFTHTVFEGTIAVSLELHDFPFDTSDVLLTFRANRHRLRDGETGPEHKGQYRLLPQRASVTAAQPQGAPGGDPLSLHTRLGLPEWRYVAARADFVERRAGTADTYRVAVTLTRNSTFFVDKVLVPLMMITVLNGFVFAIDAEELGARLQHSVALFLSALALLFVVGEELPKTQYRTAIDKTNFLLVASVLVSVIVHHVPDVDSRANMICTAAYAAAFAFYSVAVFVPLWLKRSRTLKRAFSAGKGEVEVPLTAVTASGKAVSEYRNIFNCPGMLDHVEAVTDDLTADIPLFLASSLFDPAASPGVIFVKASSEHRLVFEHAKRLRAGEACPMTLTSHPGYTVALHMPRAMKLGGRYLMVGLGVSPVDTVSVPTVTMRYEDDNFLVHQGNAGREGYEEYPPMVANIDNWLYEEGSGVGLLASPDPKGTRMSGGGRDFVINEDGTISATKVPGCVLGVKFCPAG